MIKLYILIILLCFVQKNFITKIAKNLFKINLITKKII